MKKTYVKLSSFRIPRDNKPYYERIIQDFCDLKVSENDATAYVEIGKQDTRGIPAITLCTSSHCVIKQEHFNSAKELLSYCVGYLHASGEL
jgi:hypothetical protein